MTTKEKVIQMFKEFKELSAKEIADELMVSNQTVHNVLKKLLDDDYVIKLGSPPKTIYRLNQNQKEQEKLKYEISTENENYLAENFLVITETGDFSEGITGFEYWCRKRKLPVEKTLKEYLQTKKKYEKYYNKNFIINGIEKIKNTKGYDNICLDNLYYFDFYAIERFGKTRLGTILHFAKQGQNKMLMKLLIDEIRDKTNQFTEKYNFDAVGFVPPTIKREVQIMKFIQAKLKINLPHVEIIKINNLIPIPQKSLPKLEERINNAENSFVVKSNQKFKNLLLIDDAVGSGSTLNQIAGKFKNKKIADKVTGIAIVGSFKGFDIITDL